MTETSSTTPKFSIITICRNEADAIERTCESIIGQEHTDYEWIVIDGASTDGTLEILARYKDQITMLITEEDNGIYDAMNKGIERANGQYIAFMNGGDAFSSNKVLGWAAEAPDADLIYGQLELNESGGELLEQPETFDRQYLIKYMVHHQATFFHHSLFQRFGNYDTRYIIAADYDFYLRALLEGKVSHQYVAKPFAIFDRSGISSIEKYRRLRKRENHWIRIQYFPEYRSTAKAWRQRLRNLVGCHLQPKSQLDQTARKS